VIFEAGHRAGRVIVSNVEDMSMSTWPHIFGDGSDVRRFFALECFFGCVTGYRGCLLGTGDAQGRNNTLLMTHFQAFHNATSIMSTRSISSTQP